MSGLQLRGITKTFGPITAVSDIDLDLPEGTFVSFLGPSGCGKTTLLRIIAGLETPTAGEVILDGADISRVPTHQRNVGMVFQSLALFPHLSVGDNITYGLRIRGVDKKQRRVRADELLDLVQLPGVADRHVSQLSGGQRQRVGARTQAVPARRAAVGARRQAARGHAGRAAHVAAASRRHDHRRHPTTSARR